MDQVSAVAPLAVEKQEADLHICLFCIPFIPINHSAAQRESTFTLLSDQKPTQIDNELSNGLPSSGGASKVDIDAF